VTYLENRGRPGTSVWTEFDRGTGVDTGRCSSGWPDVEIYAHTWPVWVSIFPARVGELSRFPVRVLLQEGGSSHPPLGPTSAEVAQGEISPAPGSALVADEHRHTVLARQTYASLQTVFGLRTWLGEYSWAHLPQGLALIPSSSRY